MRPKIEDRKCPFCGFVESDYAPTPHHLLPRTVLHGRYVIGSVIGEGGFGITYHGWDMNVERIVAIKEYFPIGFATRNNATGASITGVGDTDDSTFQRGRKAFIHEARTLARFFSHPGVVSVIEYFEENDTAYIAMEYIEGMSMERYAVENGGKLSVQRTLDLMRLPIDSLVAVHAGKLLHRDISPDNLIIDPEGYVKLIDFGAARFIVDETSRMSMTVVLRPSYGAFEQYSSSADQQGPWTDVYGLCATVYRLITGQKPEESIIRLQKEQLGKGALMRPSQLGVKIDPAVEEALMQGLAVLPEKRIRSMQELRAALYKDSPPSPVPLPRPSFLAGMKKFVTARNAAIGMGIAVVATIGVLLLITGQKDDVPAVPTTAPSTPLAATSAPASTPAPTPDPTPVPPPVSFKDPVFEKLVRNAMGVGADQPVYAHQLSNRTALMLGPGTVSFRRHGDPFESVGEEPITSLEDLALFPALKSLVICGNEIGDLSYISRLTNLERLHIENVPAHLDLSVVAGLRSVVDLNLRGMHLTDISPLASMIQLANLDLDHNNIRNISYLAALKNLRTLGLNDNPVADITPLIGLQHLTELRVCNWSAHEGETVAGDGSALLANLPRLAVLELRNVHISDPAPLAKMGRMETLALIDCGLEDTSFLANMPLLHALRLQNMPVDPAHIAWKMFLRSLALNDTGLEDISFLGSVPRLEHLELCNNRISDFSPLAGLRNLNQLWIQNTGLQDLSFLEDTRRLQTLGIGHNNINDISAIANLQNLTGFFAHDNYISDLSPLSGLANLECLDLGNNLITDVSPLAGLKGLKELNVRGRLHGVAVQGDVSALLAGNPDLEILQLEYAVIEDPSVLRNLTRMEQLCLNDCGVQDVSFLANMPGLTWLEMRGVTVASSALAGLTELRYLNLADAQGLEDAAFLRSIPRLIDLRLYNVPLKTTITTDDVAGLYQLDELTVHGAALHDISFIEGLQNLRILSLHNNQITDITPLANLRYLQQLELVDNPIKTLPDLANLRGLRSLHLWNWRDQRGMMPQVDISALLKNNRGLTHLMLGGFNIPDSSVLGLLPEMRKLWLHDAGLKGSAFLAFMPKLEELHLWDIPVDPSSFASMPGLRSLGLHDMQMGAGYLDQLAVLKELHELQLWGMREDSFLSFTEEFPKLWRLDVQHSRFKADYTLSGLIALTDLTIANSNLKALSPLAELTGLVRLNLQGNQISDLTPLAALKRLVFLDLSGNGAIRAIRDWSPVDHVAEVLGR